MSVTASAVAAREPPNSASRGGKKTGNVLPMPETNSIVAKASASRGLARLSRSVTRAGAQNVRRTPPRTRRGAPMDTTPSLVRPVE